MDTVDSTTQIMDEPEVSVGNELDQLYSEKMAGLKKKFLYSLQNAPKVAWELNLQGVLTEDETQSVLRNPIRQHQKETLFQMISHKKFKDIDRIMSTLESTGNDSLRWTVNFLKTQLMEAYPSSIQDVKKPKRLSFDVRAIDVEFPSERTFERRNYRSPSQRKKKRRGINTFLDENQFLFESKNRTSDVNINLNPLSFLVHQAATDGDSEILEELFNLKPDLTPHAVDPENGRTPLHSAMLSPSRQNALKCVKVLIARFKEQLNAANLELDLEQKQNALDLFLNHKDRQGLTVMHLAAEAEYLEVIKYLYDNHRCDIFIRCKDGFTPLDVMYQKTPEAVVHFLNGALPTAYSHEAGNYTLEIDFSTVIGASKAEERYKHPETDMLAKLVFQNTEAAKVILPHVIVKTFLDLKWQKMKYWLYGSIILQVLLLICYTSFVMQIFLVDCPYSQLHKQYAREINETILKWKGWRRKTFFVHDRQTSQSTVPGLLKYLIGDLMEMELSQFVVRILPNKTRACSISIPQWVLLITFIVFGCFIVCKEVGEIVILSKIFFNGRRKRLASCSNIWVGLTSYLNNVENIFQIIFLVLLFFQASLAFDYISELHYSAGALSIVVAWSLILMHFGNIYGLGTYVQILGKVIKIFMKIMGTYFVLIVAFAIAFSIMFPEMKQFETFPKSFSRVIIMMTGELDYSATFYPNTTMVSPVVVVPVTGHILFISFVLLLCVILINLLVGLTVYDIEGLRGKSEVILRSIQIEKLYVMENSLFALNCLISCVRNAVVRLYDPTRCGPGMYLDIFVVEQDEDEDSLEIDESKGLHGMVVIKSIKEIPKKLQKEIRAMAEDVNHYVQTYLKK